LHQRGAHSRHKYENTNGWQGGQRDEAGKRAQSDSGSCPYGIVFTCEELYECGNGFFLNTVNMNIDY